MLYEITSRDVTTKDYAVPCAFTGSSRREETDMGEILDWLFFDLARRNVSWVDIRMAFDTLEYLKRGGRIGRVQAFLGSMLKESFFYRSLLPSFEIDLSSVHPHFESMTRTSLIEEFYEEISAEETLEYDIIVRMPPVREYTMWVKVKSVEKATPRIVEPEGF